jgi:hypothetical protein
MYKQVNHGEYYIPKEWFQMKRKTVCKYLLSFFGLSVLFSACYYISYLRALNEFNKRAIERNHNYAKMDVPIKPTQQLAAEKTQSRETNVQTAQKVLPSTKYILEIYDKRTGTTKTQQELNPPGYLIGLTRDEIVKYLSDYMKDMTLSEFNKGLTAYELESFSGEKVVIRKSYDETIVPSRYYVVVKNGYVVVYNSDLKSVYTYTQIEAEKLPEEDRIALSTGIYVDNLEDLYALLESYSS